MFEVMQSEGLQSQWEYHLTTRLSVYADVYALHKKCHRKFRRKSYVQAANMKGIFGYVKIHGLIVLILDRKITRGTRDD